MKTEIWIVRLVGLFLDWRKEKWGCVMGRFGSQDYAVAGLGSAVRRVLDVEMKGRSPRHGIRVVVDREKKRFRIEAILCKDKNCSACAAVISEGLWIPGGDKWRTISGNGSA